MDHVVSVLSYGHPVALWVIDPDPSGVCLGDPALKHKSVCKDIGIQAQIVDSVLTPRLNSAQKGNSGMIEDLAAAGACGEQTCTCTCLRGVRDSTARP